MPKFIIERDVSGASAFSARELHDMSRKSIDAIREVGKKIQWVQSYITEDKIYCEYIAQSEDVIREHARRGGFPVTRISRVQAVIDPVTAEWQTIRP